MKFDQYKEKIIGDGVFPAINENGKKIVYADWAASGRLYLDVERKMMEEIAPYYSNIHTELNYIAQKCGDEYEKAKEKIKRHFGCTSGYAVIACGQGMTSAVHKFQDVMRDSKKYAPDKTIVLVTEYEHNSNFISWKNRGYRCVILKRNEEGGIDVPYLKTILDQYGNHEIIASFTACSNVTGVLLRWKEAAECVKQRGGLVCIDYTTLAPYGKINVAEEGIDALFFSGHKFLGGPGSTGILILKEKIYDLAVPTETGGGVMEWINPEGTIAYRDRIDDREEAGTPPILQVVRLGFAIDVKEQMGTDAIIERESELTQKMLAGLKEIKDIDLYEARLDQRLPIFSFNVHGKSYEEAVLLLDREFGIEARGGCCCVSIYGHKLLEIDYDASERNALKPRDRRDKYGWVRISLAPFTSDAEVDHILDSINRLGKSKCLSV